MQPETRESEAAPNPYAPPAPPTPEAVRKARAKRAAQENALLEKALLHTFLLSAAAAIVPGIVGIRVPGGLLLLFVVLVGLAGGHKASSSWPRRILYAVPFVTMTLGMVLGPSLFESVGVMPVAEFVIFSMIGAVPGLVLYGVVRFVVNRVSPPDAVD
jgi:hypothetical protein